MKIKLLLAASLLFFGFSNAQTSSWKPVNNSSLTALEKMERVAMPSEFHLFNVNLAQLKQDLQASPGRSAGLPGVLLAFPDADGKLQHYRMYEAGVMQPGLAAAHPDMQSYAGQGVEDPTATMRVSVTSWGLHAMVLSSKGTFYTDPYTKDLQNYIVYKKQNLVEDRQFECHTESDNGERTTASAQSVFSNDSRLRTYRLAMACTVEYAGFHITRAGLENASDDEKVAAVLAAMVVTVTRVNAVYERELAVTMVLVENNQDLIFIDGEDNLSNDSPGALINESQSFISSVIGVGGFDIGHTVSTGGGGLAGLGVVCSNNGKARGITGSNAPVGDPYDIDYVAHEVGHQFGASHTFNGASGSCNGNREPSTAVEPGSGTTIMAYANLCGAGNVQANSDDYFHAVSLAQIFEFIGFINCAEETAINNTAPTVPSVTSRNVPMGTALVLRGSVATDAQSDALTYSWEQTNAFGEQINRPNDSAEEGPNFRSLPPSTARDRYLPELQQVLDYNLAPTWEVIPNVARSLTFAYTVRDNNILGGQTSRRNMTVNVRDAGPFVVTSQGEENISWEQGSQQTITWDVAGTDANNINTARVNILLSTDGGQTFTTVLVAGTDNDGSETITVPNLLAPNCRLMVEAVNNIYYSVNATPFSVGYAITEECNTYTNVTAINIPDNNTAFTTSSINVGAVNIIQSVEVNVNATHTAVGNLIIKAISPTGTEVVLMQRRCPNSSNINIDFSDNGVNLNCNGTNSGSSYRPTEVLSAFNGQNAIGNWNLAIADVLASNTGSLNSWSITVCGQVFTPLSATQFTLKDFALYPNPNTGSFTVQFTPSTQEAIGVTVHDMRGREVFKNSYTSTGLFSNTINLQNTQSGIYMVTVQNGSRKEVRKIVVQ